MPRGLDAFVWKLWFRAQAADERVLLTSSEHAYDRVLSAFERLCVDVTGSPTASRARGDWPRRRPTHRLEARLREFGPGAVHVAIAAHPIALSLRPKRGCERAVRQAIKTLMYE